MITTSSRPAAKGVRSAIALAKRAVTRVTIFVIDVAFLLYLFVMGSYVVTRIASGVGHYIPIPGGFVVLLALVVAAVWGGLGVSVGRKTTEFLTGKPSRAPKEHEGLGRSGATASSVGPARGPWYHALWGWSVALMIVVTLAAAVLFTQVDFSKLSKNFPFAANMFVRFFHPDWTIGGEVVSLTIVTIFMALMATLLAIPIGVVLSFFAARNLTRGPIGSPVYFLVRALASVVRSIEPIIWAIVFVIWVRMGPFPGALALFVSSIADLTKLYSEQLESIDTGPTEAITAVGGRRLQVLLYGIVPQIINPYLSFTLYRWDINVRMATIIGVVGGGGIGNLLMQYVRVNAWEQVSTCLLAIIIVVWSIDTLSARLRARLA